MSYLYFGQQYTQFELNWGGATYTEEAFSGRLADQRGMM